jgi:short-subunit dehydrogenase
MAKNLLDYLNNPEDLPSVLLPQTPCPHCGYVTEAGRKATATMLDSTSENMVAVDNPEIKEDSVTICVNCATFLKYDAYKTLNLITVEDMLTMPVELIAMMQQLREIVHFLQDKGQIKTVPPKRRQ